jgi:SAM-dependent methyltransferase
MGIRAITGTLGRRLAASLGYWVQRGGSGGNPYNALPAWSYQEPIVAPRLRATDVVLDIGSGNYPSPRADIVADFFPDETFHRSGRIVEVKPVVVCSVERMPFRRASIDFVICSHVLEHVDSPRRAASELCRVARAGYAETPAYGKDILVGSGHMHRWQVVEFEGTMHFFEYSTRQKQAFVTSPVMDIWMSPQAHPWQRFFWERQDLFNAWTVWKDSLSVVEHRRGTNEPALPAWQPVQPGALPPSPSALTPDEIALLERCLTTPDGGSPMRFVGDAFVNGDGSVRYPVRGKRIYCEVGAAADDRQSA